LSRFVDEAAITICSGEGGRGAVSFRHEKWVPKGGPDGGDGGDGGDVVFRAEDNMRSLYEHKIRQVYRAKNGSPGSRRNMKGRKGLDCVIRVPRGTVILDGESGKLLADFARDEEVVLLKGGKGGHGNAYFATSTNRAPRYAQEGTEGQKLGIILQIKTIADVGVVGLPNAGKSTLLSILTEARPKIGSYPFTTLTPNLGVMEFKAQKQVVIADVPGLVEGASHGVGLGIQFLKHIERTKVLLILIDLSEGDYMRQYKVLNGEMKQYSRDLLIKPRLVVGSKRDIVGQHEEESFLHGPIPGEKFCISSQTQFNITILKERIVAILEKADA
jgi:GTP-binding protein